MDLESKSMGQTGPHQGQPVYRAGAELSSARLGMILLHGRGATAGDILALANEIEGSGVAYLAPQAANRTWYPYSFLEPIARNEPGLTSGLAVIAQLLETLDDEGLPAEQVMLLGFSQGACLAMEFAARHARRYAGLIGLSGGLIGPSVERERYQGSLEGAPIFLGCSDVDPHIPRERVEETAEVMQALGGQVTKRLYPNMPHTVNRDEIDVINEMLSAALGGNGA